MRELESFGSGFESQWAHSVLVQADRGGLSRERVANALGVSNAAVRDYEAAELNDAITLRTFKRVAAALDCELVCALVPRNRSALASSQPPADPNPAADEPSELASHLK